MKNKIKVIDISIVSTYMGRYLTAVVFVLVLAITLSALLMPGGLNTDTILVGVAPRGDRSATLAHYEPLRALLERSTGSFVQLRVSEESWSQACDLFVMSVHEFRRVRQTRGLVAACSVEPPGGFAAAAVITPGSVRELPDSASSNDVMYTAPHSINGCWLQLRALERKGTVEKRSLDELEFAPPPGHAERVVFGVISGQFRMGAVPRAVVTEMIAEGRIAAEEVNVALSVPALPEIVLCRRDAGEPAPQWLPLLTARETGAPLDSEPVLRPVGREEMDRLDALFEYVSLRR